MLTGNRSLIFYLITVTVTTVNRCYFSRIHSHFYLKLICFSIKVRLWQCCLCSLKIYHIPICRNTKPWGYIILWRQHLYSCVTSEIDSCRQGITDFARAVIIRWMLFRDICLQGIIKFRGTVRQGVWRSLGSQCISSLFYKARILYRTIAFRIPVKSGRRFTGSSLYISKYTFDPACCFNRISSATRPQNCQIEAGWIVQLINNCILRNLSVNGRCRCGKNFKVFGK